jgi:hypothetical protein
MDSLPLITGFKRMINIRGFGRGLIGSVSREDKEKRKLGRDTSCMVLVHVFTVRCSLCPFIEDPEKPSHFAPASSTGAWQIYQYISYRARVISCVASFPSECGWSLVRLDRVTHNPLAGFTQLLPSCWVWRPTAIDQ